MGGGGIGDVREGFSIGAGASVGQSFSGKGKSFNGFLSSLKAGSENGELVRFIADLMTSMPKLIAEVLRLVNLDLKAATTSGELARSRLAWVVRPKLQSVSGILTALTWLELVARQLWVRQQESRHLLAFILEATR